MNKYFATFGLGVLVVLGCSFKNTGEVPGDGTGDATDVPDVSSDVPTDGLDVPADVPDDLVPADGADAVPDSSGDVAGEDADDGWLDGWGRRVMLLLDHDDVPDNLVDFPALVHLSATAGREGEDVTFVFDELTDDSMRWRIAITQDDGVTECPVEIDSWSSSGREAWLWVGVPLVSYMYDTVLFLYFDSTRPDNTAHVGDTNDPAAELVWDPSFSGVYHLSEGSGPDTFDSSLLNNHCGLSQSDNWSAGRVAGTYAMDGDDDWAFCGDHASLRPEYGLTVAAWLDVGAYDDWNAAVAQQWDNGSNESGYWLGTISSGGPFVFWVNTVLDGWIETTYDLPTGEWHHVVGTYDGTAIRLYVDAVEVGSSATSGAINYDPLPYGFYIGRYHDSNEDSRMDVTADEVHVSGVARSPAWIRASFESQRDDFVDFGVVETP
ncbi:MAG: LamG domain-containing protein [Deltaproteobacteria bacterium]|nr:LamG domain-containing protein [Deltaproteobacteria bacterium]